VAVKIRLMRVGKKKQPTYRVVVADGRSPRDGRFIEIIGQYGPREDPSRVQIDSERALSWLRNGAQPTEQVQKLLAVTGVWAEFESERGGKLDTKLNRRRLADTTPKPKGKSKKAQAKEAAAAAAPATAEPAADTPEAPAAEAPDADASESEAPEAETEAAASEADTAEGEGATDD
jgi:small subunit ribosomal protein S16